MWPHLTSADIELIVGLRALWKAPEWGLKVLALAYAVRRYRKPSLDARITRMSMNEREEG
jgi:hypothetical protein